MKTSAQRGRPQAADDRPARGRSERGMLVLALGVGLAVRLLHLALVAPEPIRSDASG